MDGIQGLRRRGRICALQILYQMDMAGELVGVCTAKARAKAATRRFFDCFAEPGAGETGMTTALVDGVTEGLMALDARISAVSTRWRLTRMTVVDRNVLRLAAFEMEGPDGLPKEVAVNEAVEIARAYGGAESPAFVNAVLDRLTPACCPAGP